MRVLFGGRFRSPARPVVRAAIKRQQAKPQHSSTATQLNEVVCVEGDLVCVTLPSHQLTTQAMRAMLRGDRYAAQQCQDDLDSAVRELVAQDNKAAARYLYVLYNMCQHKLVDEADTLEVRRYTQDIKVCTLCTQEQYQEALHRMWALLEDSGWRLAREGQEEQDPQQQALTAQADLIVAPPGAEHVCGDALF